MINRFVSGVSSLSTAPASRLTIPASRAAPGPALRLARLAGLIAGLAVLLIPCGPARAQDDDEGPVGRRMKRQIGVLESIVDQVLLDSPNFLVSSSRNAHGLYLDGFGVLVTFEASLVDTEGWGDWGNKFRMETDKDGRTIVIIPDPDEDDDERDDDEGSSWIERHRRREARLYSNGKQEMVETILDYGDTVTSLADEEWLAIAAFLKDSDYFMESRISRLIMKARMKDLRSYAEGKISEEEMVARFVEEEY